MKKMYVGCLWLVCTAALSYAQTDSQQDSEQTPTIKREAPLESSNNGESPNTKQSADNENEGKKEPASSPTGSSNAGSFVPSEEISEDLSVSFPVDI